MLKNTISLLAFLLVFVSIGCTKGNTLNKNEISSIEVRDSKLTEQNRKEEAKAQKEEEKNLLKSEKGVCKCTPAHLLVWVNSCKKDGSGSCTCKSSIPTDNAVYPGKCYPKEEE